MDVLESRIERKGRRASGDSALRYNSYPLRF
jgi:hypothetical protein